MKGFLKFFSLVAAFVFLPLFSANAQTPGQWYSGDVDSADSYKGDRVCHSVGKQNSCFLAFGPGTYTTASGKSLPIQVNADSADICIDPDIASAGLGGTISSIYQEIFSPTDAGEVPMKDSALPTGSGDYCYTVKRGTYRIAFTVSPGLNSLIKITTFGDGTGPGGASYSKATGGGGGATTSGGGVTYPTLATDDFAIGGTTSAAPLFFDAGTGDFICNVAGCSVTTTPSLTAPDAAGFCERGNYADGGSCEGPLIGAADTNWTTQPELRLAEDGTFTEDYETAVASGYLTDPGWGLAGLAVPLTAITTVGSGISVGANSVTLSKVGVYRFEAVGQIIFPHDGANDAGGANCAGLAWWDDTNGNWLDGSSGNVPLMMTVDGPVDGPATTGGGAMHVHSYSIHYQVTTVPVTVSLYGSLCPNSTENWVGLESKTLQSVGSAFVVERIK